MGELADKLSKLQRLEVTRKHWCQMREGVKSKARGRDTRWKWMGGDTRGNMGLEMCEGGCGKENGEDITCNW